MAWESKLKAAWRTLQFPMTGTFRAPATSTATATTTFSGGLGIKNEGGVAHAPVPNDWHIQGLGDFDGDGKSDLLWRHDSGQVYIWEMNGLGVKAEGGVVHAPVPNDWHIDGQDDFDSDAKRDNHSSHDSVHDYN